MSAAREVPAELRERIASYPQTGARKDVEGVAEYLLDDFTIHFLHPAPQTVTKAEWLELLPHIETRDYRVISDVLTLQADDVAVHHGLIQMETTMRGVERSGLFAMTDVWLRSADGVWHLSQRHSVPLSATTLPV